MKNSNKNSRTKKWIVGAAAALAVVGASVGALSGGPSNVATAATPAPGTKSELEERLAASGSDTIQVSGDVTISGLAYVNGDKTLTGTGRVLAENGEQYILVINDGASLTLDGPTLDGTDSAENGVYVSPDASFEMEAGSIENLKGHGVRVLGDAEISGGSIEKVGTNWVMVDEGAELKVSDAEFTDAGDIGIITGADSETELNNVKLSDAGANLVYNGGSMTIDGGSFSGAGDYAIHNEAKLEVSNVNFSGATILGYVENAKTGECKIDGGSMTDSRADFIYNQGVLDVSNVKFDGCSGSAIESKSTSADVSVSDCTFENIGKSVALIKGGEMDMENVKAGHCGDCFIHNYGMNFTGKNISVEDVDNIAFYNDFDTSNVSCGNFTVDGFEIGHAASYGVRNDGGTLSLSNGTVGKCDSYGMYAKDGDVETNKVSFLGTNDTGRAVVQIGYSSGNTHAVVKMYDTDITGGARGITNHDTCYFYSGNIYGNYSSGDATVGGAINNDGTFYLYGGTLSFNHAVGSGGAIYNSGTMEVYCPAVIAYNITDRYGGGIYSNGSMAFYGGVVYNNTSIEGGGGIFNGGAADLYYGSVYNNYTAGSGGGVYTGGSGKTSISGLNIYSNISGKSGGGAYTLGSTTLGAGTTISGNTAGSYGGGAATGNSSDGTKHGSMLIDGAVISGNSATSGGGGVYNPASLTMRSGEITGNTSAANGGGMYITSNGTTSISGGTIGLNDATSAGGGIHNLGDTSVSGVTIYGNTAGTNGGGISNGTANSGQEGKLTIGEAYIVENTASNRGGGVYNNGTASITGGKVRGNVGGSEPENGVYTSKSLSVSGSPDIDSIHKTSDGTINVGTLSSDTSDPTTVYLDNYDIGTNVIKGSTAAEKEHFTLPAAQVSDGKFIDDDGNIGGTPKKVASYNGEEYESIKAAVTDLIEDGTSGEIKLIDSVSGESRIEFRKNSSDKTAYTITLNLDGQSIETNSTSGAMLVNSASTITITGSGTVKPASGVDGYLFFANSGGTIDVEGGNYEGFTYIKSSGSSGAIVINNGSFKDIDSLLEDKGSITINGGTFDDFGSFIKTGGTVTVTGGNFSNFDTFKSGTGGTLVITGGTFDQDPSEFVPSTHEAKDNGDGTWTVQKKSTPVYLVSVNGENFEVLEGKTAGTALSKIIDLGTTPVTVKFLNSTSTSSRLEPRTGTSDTTARDITFDFNGNTVTAGAVFVLANNGTTVTLCDSTGTGTLDCSGNNLVSMNSGSHIRITSGNYRNFAKFVASSSSDLKISGGTFDQDPTSFLASGYEAVDNHDGTWTVQPSAAPPDYVAMIGSDGYETIEEALQAAVGKSVTIELLKDVTLKTRSDMGSDTTITFTGKSITIDPDKAGLYNVKKNCTLTINGGDIRMGTTNSNKYIAYLSSGGNMVINGGFFSGFTKTNGGSGTPTIYGGTFSYNPTDNVATGYEAKSNGDGTWTVSKIALGAPAPIVEEEIPASVEETADVADIVPDATEEDIEELAPETPEETAEPDKPEENRPDEGEETQGPVAQLVEDIIDLFKPEEEKKDND